MMSSVAGSKAWRWWGTTLFGMLGLGLLWSAAVDAYRSEALRHGAMEADAVVVDARDDSCKGWRCLGAGPHQLRYRFEAGPERRQYDYTGRWLFVPAWVQVPETAFNEARAAGHLRILYLPSNPRVNQPAVLRVRHSWESLGLWLLAVLMLLLAGALARHQSTRM